MASKRHVVEEETRPKKELKRVHSVTNSAKKTSIRSIPKSDAKVKVKGKVKKEITAAAPVLREPVDRLAKKKRKQAAKESTVRSIFQDGEKPELATCKKIKLEKTALETKDDSPKKAVELVSDTLQHKKKLKKQNTVAEEVITNSEKQEKTVKPKLEKKQVTKGIQAVFALVKQQSKKKNALFKDEQQPIFLQVVCIKIPKVSTRHIRMVLPHTLVTETDEVALFVKDLERGRRRDYEPTVQHFEDVLRSNGVERITDVIPLNRLKTEFDQYELKKKLRSSYDFFLSDARISGHVSHLLGNLFKKRQAPTPVRMDSKNLKREIDFALRKTCTQLHSNGDTITLQVGHSCMKEKEILENVTAAWDQLGCKYPGGWSNVRSLILKTPSSLAVPIYVTLKSGNDVKVPAIPPRRPKAYKTVRGELSTLSGNTTVTMTPEGEITLDREEDSEEEEEEDDSDAE